MNPSVIGIIGLAVLFLIMAMGVPIGFAMALSGLVALPFLVALIPRCI